MKRITKNQILSMHDLLIRETGGSHGIVDEGLLESAINSPFQTYDGSYVYEGIQLKAAKLAYFIINNHPFVDGNKRVGILAMLTFLELNNMEINCSDKDLIDIGMNLASGKMNERELLDWITNHS